MPGTALNAKTGAKRRGREHIEEQRRWGSVSKSNAVTQSNSVTRVRTMYWLRPEDVKR